MQIKSEEVLPNQEPTVDIEVKPEGLGFDQKLEFSNNDPITYVWKNVSVSVGPETELEVMQAKTCCNRCKTTETKQILVKVSGIARPGEFIALMGASGAGKTTFLNVLTFRNIRNLRITGDLKCNGLSVNREMLSAISAYVQQDDLFIGTLTVREHLVFQARLRMTSSIPWTARLQRVEEVIDELGLRKSENTQIGIPGRIKGISGGEMKRLSFASEVLTDPPLMFCDEPTSGLDSHMAQNVVQVLKQLAAKGKTVICTIHQPSSQIFSMFDKILLIAEGRTAYLGSASTAVDYFSRLGYPCPSNFNPADHFMHILAVQPGKNEESKLRIKAICDAYESSDASLMISSAVNLSLQSQQQLSPESAMKKRSPYKASWLMQFRTLLWRCWLSQVKDTVLLKVRIGITAFISLLYGLIYLQQDRNQEGIMNMNGALFLFITNMTFQNVFRVINVS